MKLISKILTTVSPFLAGFVILTAQAENRSDFQSHLPDLEKIIKRAEKNNTPIPTYLWSRSSRISDLGKLHAVDDVKGMSCQREPIDSQVFSLRVMEASGAAKETGFENMRSTPMKSGNGEEANSWDNIIAKIPMGSVVRYRWANKKVCVKRSRRSRGSCAKWKKTRRSSWHFIEIVSIPSDVQAAPKGFRLAGVGDHGWVASSSLRRLDDYVFTLGTNRYTTAVSSNHGIDTSDYFFSPERDKDQNYVAYSCCTRKRCQYKVNFLAFDKQTGEMTSEIAIPTKGANIIGLFNSAKAYSRNFIRQHRTDIKRKNEQRVAQKKEHKKTTIPLPSKNKRKVKVVEGFERVICLSSNDSTLSVKAENLRRTLFNARNGTVVKVFQGWNGGKPKVRVLRRSSKKRREVFYYLKIQTAAGRIGHVPRKFLKPQSECASVLESLPAKSNSEADESETDESKKEEKTSAGSQPGIKPGTYRICTESGSSLRVRNTNFVRQPRKFNLANGEQVVLTRSKVLSRSGYKFVQVNTNSNYTRYVPKQFLTQGTCVSFEEQRQASEKDDDSTSAKVVNGYSFPVYHKTGFSYLWPEDRPRPVSRSYFNCRTSRSCSGYNSGFGAFGHSRSSGGRAHAATDLYQPFKLKRPSRSFSARYYGGPFRAMQSGRILRSRVYFYLGTYYMVARHKDGKVARYGEIYQSLSIGRRNRSFKTGEQLGHIKWVGISAVPPMLHFELYSGKRRSTRRGYLGGGKRERTYRLSKKGKKYSIGRKSTQRASDLLDESEFIKNLEVKTFGL